MEKNVNIKDLTLKRMKKEEKELNRKDVIYWNCLNCECEVLK